MLFFQARREAWTRTVPPPPPGGGGGAGVFCVGVPMVYVYLCLPAFRWASPLGAFPSALDIP